MNKSGFATPQIVIFVLALAVIVGGYLLFIGNKANQNIFTGCTLEAKVCSDGSAVGRTGPLCEFAACPTSLINISSPKAEDVVSSPVSISGSAQAGWGIFEGQAGTVTLYDGKENNLGTAILTVIDDWMQPEVQFTASLNFANFADGIGKLVFKNDNASGDPARDKRYEMPVNFVPVPLQMRKVNLFYYNKTKDTDISCDSNAVLSVAREIPLTMTPVQDAVKLLLKGVLKDEEKSAGFQTEFPLGGFSLNRVRSENGTLILKFDDLEGRSGGGSCRVGLLWSQISKTVLQFPEIKGVKFEPETLFQP